MFFVENEGILNADLVSYQLKTQSQNLIVRRDEVLMLSNLFLRVHKDAGRICA